MAAPNIAKIAGTLTTIYWGTKGSLATPTGLAGVIVEDYTVTPKNAGPIAEIENGDGATVAIVTLDDGFDAKVRMIYDKSLTWPAVGDPIGINLPKIGGSGGVTTYNCILASIPSEVKRKEAARIEMTLIYRPGVDTSTYTSVTNLG